MGLTDLLRTFVTLKNPSIRPGLKPRTLGPMASTLIIIPPRRLPFTLLSIVTISGCLASFLLLLLFTDYTA
jgi:hypothetical protein